MTFSTKRTITLICMDILLVAELTYAFAKSFSTTGDFSETFLHCYVPMFVPTIVVPLCILKYFKRREKAAQSAMETSQTALEP